jgi:hypothetical protein
MRSARKALKLINNDQKAYGFLKGARQINEESFSNFKKRIEVGGMDMLEELPYIGPVTKKLLAKNIGLRDIPKDDRYLRRIKDKYSARSVDSLAEFLSNKFQLSQHVVDVVLWRYCSVHRRID